MKATYIEIGDNPVDIFKDPATDDGMKKSNCGLLKVYTAVNGKLAVKEKVTWEEEAESELEVIFCDGELIRFQTLSEIRGILASERAKLA
jgi:nicotinamide phosphoribosyltransferase